MKIKRLEISGFKSFADKVVLDFQQGVTGVVGPNGCGKSNIVDAIRWCMGEQSAKNLRGKAMEDVIFAGSETRKPLGMAEVSLTFSTEDGRAPARYLDYAEIQLTRRLYRDGDSDYLINRTPCRLLDITELFMDTGVGTRAYSIIEQGKIGQILHSRPEERRFLIEEAAGVTKFKSRKQLALKKIEGTRANLARLGDVLGEIRRQLGSLQRQARKAEKFREYRDELREIELLFTAREYWEIRQQRELAERELTGLNDRLRDSFAAAGAKEARVEEARLALAEAERRLAAAQEEIFGIRSAYGSAESALEYRRKELSALTARLARLESETGELGGRLTECTEQRRLMEVRRDGAATESAGLQAELLAAEGELAAHQQGEEALGSRLETRRKELFAAMSEAAQFKSRLDSVRKGLESLSERRARHGRDRVQLAERLETVRSRAAGLEAEHSAAGQERELLRVELSSLRQQEDELKVRLPEVEKQWQSRRDELNRSSSRLHSLREMEARFTGYGQGVRSLMAESRLRPRFGGVLADAVFAPPELEAALEAVLADRLQSVLCGGEGDVLDALAFLKERNGGRAGLALAVEYEPEKVEPPAGSVPLDAQVRVEGPYLGLVRRLLAGVMLVEELGQALSLARSYPDLSFVTREGDLVALGGLVSGGSAEQVASGIIHKKREIRELEERVALLERETASLGEERERLRRQVQELGEGVKRTGSLLHQAELKLAGLAKDRQQVTDEIARAEERAAVQELEAETLAEEHQALLQEQTAVQEQMNLATEKSRSLEEEVNGLKEQLESGRALLGGVRERVTSLRVRVATLREQHESHQRGIADLERQVGDLERRVTADREELERGTAERARLQGAIDEGSGHLETLVLSQARAEESLAGIRATHEAAGALMADLEAGARVSREEHDQVRQAQADLKLRFSTLTMQAEHLERAVQEKSRVPMAEALERLGAADFDEAERRTRQTDLQRMLDELGEVNLMAIEECAGMEERFTFLTAQKEDLEESLRGLQQAIQRINRTTRQRFQETYNLVNAKFQEVFPRLFCGGRAELRLTNEEDLLETGIDIIVQPPGKKLQNVTLLSGGEKALTAVALIFSIFLIKPTPFCLLDEVDAPLDDANIGRFNEMVREMSAISQFIIITHNKATMQVADSLYGITMEEPGASRVVSVRLH